MSIGFLGSRSSQQVFDVFSGNAGSRIDISLQSVLSKYDSIRTDLDRLEESARQKVFNVTSREHYNMYLKEAVNGWAETWYSEYRAVLVLRADALQKKLQAAYNRVLDRSVYAKIDPNQDSVFAPYANRTFSGADVDYKMIASQVFVQDAVAGATSGVTDAPTTTPSPTTPYQWTQMIHDYIVNGRKGDGTYSAYSNKISISGSDLDSDGRTFQDNASNPESGNSGTIVRDPRMLWGQYPFDNTTDRNTANANLNIMTPPWPTYYKEVYTGPPTSPIFYVEAKSGSYYSALKAKIDPPASVTLSSGSYYNTVTGQYYSWDPADALDSSGFVTTTTPVPTNVGALQDVNIGTDVELANEVVAVTSGGYWNYSTYTFNSIQTVTVNSGQWYKNDGLTAIVVQGTSGTGFTQASSNLTLRKTSIQAGFSGYTDVTQTGGYRKRAADVAGLGGNWTDITSNKVVREMTKINHPSWADVTKDTFWIPDGSKTWDINYDGTADDLDVLLDPRYYGLLDNNLVNPVDAAGSHGGTGFPADPNVIPTLLNPYLYNGSGRTGDDYAEKAIYTVGWDANNSGSVTGADTATIEQIVPTAGMIFMGGHPLIDSRYEAHAIVVREAQVDAAIKAVDDVIKQYGITQATVINKLVELGITNAIGALESAISGGSNPPIDSNGDGVPDFTNDHPGDPNQVRPFGQGETRDSAGNLVTTLITGWDPHPWGASKVVSPFHLGVDYSSILPYKSGVDLTTGANGNVSGGSTSGGWKTYSAGSVYYMVRYNLDGVANALNQPSPGTSNTPINTQYSESYAGDAAPYTVVAGADAKGNYKINLPMFGLGDVDVDFSFLPADVYDTLLSNPTASGALTQAIADIQNSFYTRQYDDIVTGNKFDADYIHVSAAVLPGWYGSANTAASPIDPPVTLASQDLIGGTLLTVAKSLAYGKLDTALSGFMAGTAVQVGGPLEYGHDSWLGGSVGPNLFYGHESAITSNHDLTFAGVTIPAPFPSPGLPTVGLFGQHADLSIPIPIPLPTGPVDVINIPMTLVVNGSYDFATMLFKEFMEKMKKPVVEAIQVQSYAASSGTAMDSYASRAEYHFSEPGYSEALKRFGIIDVDFPGGIDFFELNFGELFDNLLFDGMTMMIGGQTVLDITGMLSPDSVNEEVNHARIKDRMFNYKHSVQAAESRETETGAFFATSAFLSQFEMDQVNQSYWIGTQQNEEIVNADLMRSVSTAGKEFLKIISSALFSYGTAFLGPGQGFMSSLMMGVLQTILTPALEAQASQIMFDLLYKDQDLHSSRWFLLSALGGDIVTADFTTEAFDYIENDHKPFEADSDFNYTPSTGPLSFLNDLYTYGTPDFIMDGYANTKRFVATGNDGNVTAGNYAAYDPYSASGFGPRGYAGTGGAKGWWTDTALGDINEVYVGTRNVSFNNLKIGYNEWTNGTLASGQTGFFDGSRTTTASAKRFVGSDSRVYGRRYDPSDPVNHEVFNTNFYTGNGTHYDRRNQYSMDFKNVGGSKFSLFGSQALNPTIGGFIKLAEIDKNKYDDQLIDYDDFGVNGIIAGKNSGSGGSTTTDSAIYQQFGASSGGELNQLNRVLYEHLHLRSDGRNLSLVKEYRDVFNTGLFRNVFVSGQSYHPSGGGITSSLEIRFDPTSGRSNVQTGTREDGSVSIYNNPFQTKTKGVATIYLNTYFAHKKRAANKKT